jgi:hypothetical protein
MTNLDPFAQADGSPSVNPTDPFGQPSGGGGDFPKPAELNGCLLLLTPVKFEQVQAYQQAPGVMATRLSADTVVLTGLRAGESFDSMYWSQKPIVAAAEKAVRDKIPAILGTLRRVPIGADAKSGKYPTTEALEAALDAWRPGSAPIQFAWVLEKFAPEDAQIARDYLASKQPVSPFGA